jgi:hypothetical protein
MKKKLLIILGSIVGIIIIIFVAGVLLVSRTKDLGVRYSQKDTDSVNAKLGITYSSLPESSDPKSTLSLEGKREVDVTLTSEELTALLAEHGDSWSTYPVSDAQMRINDDGTFELSGKLKGSDWEDYALATNMPNRFKNFVGDKAKLVPAKPAFYIKGLMDVKNGQVTGDVKDVKIGSFGVDTTWFSDNNGFVTDFVEDRLSAAGINAASISMEADGLHLKGSVPEKIGFAE